MRDGGRGEGWRRGKDGGRGKDGERGEGWREGGREGGSSPFVVVGARLVVVVILFVRHRHLLWSFSNVVRPCYSLLVVGGVRCLPVVVAVFD